MRVNGVQICDAQNFKGSFYKGYAFKELEKKLSGQDKDTFETIVKNIENAKDDHQWWFDIKSIHNGAVKVATMGLLKKDGTPKLPGYFLVEAQDSLDIFKNLAKWYKNNVEGYKG